MSPQEPGDLHVRGGVAGTTATTEAIHAAGTALLHAGGQVAGVVPELSAIVGHPALVLAAALDPFGATRVVGAAAAALAGPSGLVPSAAACARLGATVHVAAEVYRVAETEAEQLASAGWRTVARGVVPPVARAALGLAPVLAPPVTVAVLLSSTAWVVVRAAPRVGPAAARLAVAGARGDVDPAALVALGLGSGRTLQVLSDDTARLALAAQAAAARHPWLVREAISTLPVVVEGVVPDEVSRVLGEVPVAGGRVDLVPDTVPEVAALAAAAAGRAGLARQGDVRVAAVGSPRPAAPAGDLTGLLGVLRPYAPPRSGERHDGYTPGRIRIDRLDGPGGTRWVLYLPPTQTWSFAGGALPADGTANVRMVGGLDSDALVAARAVLHEAGVAPGEPVMAVGYSQGGITAAALAADPRLHGQVSAVVTAGSPVSHLAVPDDVTVLALESSSDLVPELDGAVDPDRPGWTSVEREVPVDPGDPWAAHGLGGYERTAGLVDRSSHPSVLGWREQVAPFLEPSTVTTQEFGTHRPVP